MNSSPATTRTRIFQFLFLLLGISLAVLFFRANAGEMRQMWPLLRNARPGYVLAGVALTGVYIWLQGLMYVQSFRAVGARLPLRTGVSLFLRRNLASTFLPAGGITSLVFFTKRLENQGFEKTKIVIASTIYGFMGIGSVAVVAIPVLAWGAWQQTAQATDWLVLGGLLALLALLVLVVYSVFSKGILHRLLVKYFPAVEHQLDLLRAEKLQSRPIWKVLWASLGIEAVGVVHLALAMLAVGASVSWEAALLGYTVQVLFLMVSPFFRGLGVIEVSLAYILTRLGYGVGEGAAIMMLFRFFEFWLVLAVGAPVAAAYRRGVRK